MCWGEKEASSITDRKSVVHHGRCGVCWCFKVLLVIKFCVVSVRHFFLDYLSYNVVSFSPVPAGFPLFSDLWVSSRHDISSSAVLEIFSVCVCLMCVFWPSHPSVFAVSGDIVEEERFRQLLGLSGKHAATLPHAIYTHLFIFTTAAGSFTPCHANTSAVKCQFRIYCLYSSMRM